MEYDSFFEHRCLDGCAHRRNGHHTRDRAKTLRLQRMGYLVVRMRELQLDEACREPKHLLDTVQTLVSVSVMHGGSCPRCSEVVRNRQESQLTRCGPITGL